MKPTRPPATPAYLDRTERGSLLHLHVVPGASRTELAGLHGTRLKVRVRSPPVDGAANQEVLRFLAGLLDVKPSSLEIVRGATDRRKTVSVPLGVDVAAALDRSGA